MPEATRNNGVLIIKPMESIDGLAAHEFERFLDQSIAREDTLVLFDFKNVAYISSAGLRCILKVSRIMQRRNGGGALSSLSSGVRSVFAVSGFDRMFPIHATVEEALSSMNPENHGHQGETETLFPPYVRPRSDPGRS